MELFILYLFMKVDSLLFGMGMLGLVLLGCASFLGMSIPSKVSYSRFKPDWEEKFNADRAPYLKWIRRLVCIAACLWIVVLFAPNQKTIAVLVGGHYALKLADTPEAGKVMQVLRQKANDLLDEQLKEKAK